MNKIDDMFNRLKKEEKTQALNSPAAQQSQKHNNI